MASGMSIYWANQVLDKVLRGEDFTAPSTLYAAVFIGSGAAINLRNNIITDEVDTVGTGYTRVEVRGVSGITFSSATNATSVQSNDIAFPAAQASWGTVYTLALLDASDNVYIYGDIGTSQNVDVPDVLRIPASQWIVTL